MNSKHIHFFCKKKLKKIKIEILNKIWGRLKNAEHENKFVPIRDKCKLVFLTVNNILKI